MNVRLLLVLSIVFVLSSTVFAGLVWCSGNPPGASGSVFGWPNQTYVDPPFTSQQYNHYQCQWTGGGFDWVNIGYLGLPYNQSCDDLQDARNWCPARNNPYGTCVPKGITGAAVEGAVYCSSANNVAYKCQNLNLPLFPNKLGWVKLNGDCSTDTSGTICYDSPNVIFYSDNDGDGYGNTQLQTQGCSQPLGYVPNGGDCVDNNPSIHPNAGEVCDAVDNDCSGVKDDLTPSSCVQNVLLGQPDFRNGDCTATCTVCQDNKISNLALTSVTNASTTQTINVSSQTNFSVALNALSPNNCVTGYTVQLLFSADNGATWNQVRNSTKSGAGSSTFGGDGNMFLTSGALSQSVPFVMQYLPVGYKYKVRAQLYDAKKSKNVSGTNYADNGWFESNVITVTNTVPIKPSVEYLDKLLANTIAKTRIGVVTDPDIFPSGNPGSQSLNYVARIFADNNVPAPGTYGSPTVRGDFFDTNAQREYQTSIPVDATYCGEGRVFDGVNYSPVSTMFCGNGPAPVYTPTCSDLNLVVDLNSASLDSENNTTDINFSFVCEKSPNMNATWLVGVVEAKFLTSDNSVVNTTPITGVTDCNALMQVAVTRMNSSEYGSYTASFTYGGTYNGTDLNCSLQKGFLIGTSTSSGSGLNTATGVSIEGNKILVAKTASSIPDNNVLVVLLVGIIALVLISRNQKH